MTDAKSPTYKEKESRMLGLGLALCRQLFLERLLLAAQVDVGGPDQQRQQEGNADLPPANARPLACVLCGGRQQRRRDIHGGGVRRGAGGRVVVHGWARDRAQPARSCRSILMSRRRAG